MAGTIPTQSFNWSWIRLEPVSKVLQIQNFPHTLTQSTSVPRLVKCILIIAMLGCHLWCVRRLLYLPLMFQKPEHLCGLTPGQLHLLPPLLYSIWLLPQQSMTSRWQDKEAEGDEMHILNFETRSRFCFLQSRSSKRDREFWEWEFLLLNLTRFFETEKSRHAL